MALQHEKYQFCLLGGVGTKQKTPLEENTEYLICCELKPFLNVF